MVEKTKISTVYFTLIVLCFLVYFVANLSKIDRLRADLAKPQEYIDTLKLTLAVGTEIITKTLLRDSGFYDSEGRSLHVVYIETNKNSETLKRKVSLNTTDDITVVAVNPSTLSVETHEDVVYIALNKEAYKILISSLFKK